MFKPLPWAVVNSSATTKSPHFSDKAVTVKSLCCTLGMSLSLLLPGAVAGQDVHANMAQVPAGEFWMGRTHMWLIDELGMHLRPRLDDQPAHLVYLDSFWIDKYEVTNQDYAWFTEATRHRKPYHWV